LEKPDLSGPFYAYTTGRQVRHGTVLKVDPDTRDIYIRRENRHAHGVDSLHRRGNIFQDDIDVVNHQVEDDVHIRSPGLKGPDPMDLDKPDALMDGESHAMILVQPYFKINKYILNRFL
jgi:hypothetical protein